MSSNATLLLARRSIRARIGRLIAIAIAIILGVAFVVGSFVLADSMRSGFDSLFSAAFEKTDLQVRTALAFGDGSDTATAIPSRPAGRHDRRRARCRRRIRGVAAQRPDHRQ